MAQGGDWGAAVTQTMGIQAPPELARHPLQHARYRAGRASSRRSSRRPAAADLSDEELRAYEQLINFYAKHVAYAQIMSTRPQTLYGLADSPIDLAAFMLDHSDGTGQPGLIEQVLERPPARAA